MEENECVITLVNPGRADSVIKIFPAEHKEEKIWLDNTPGIERWDMIKRMMQLHASRFAPISEPVPYCNDPKDLKTITLKPSDIPIVKLEGFVLPAPAVEAIVKEEPQMSEKQWSDRFNKLEDTVNKLVTVLSTRVEIPKEEEKRKPGRPVGS